MEHVREKALPLTQDRKVELKPKTEAEAMSQEDWLTEHTVWKHYGAKCHQLLK